MSACIVVETQLPQGPLGLELVSATVNEDGSMYGISVRSAPSRFTSFVRAGTVVTSIDGQDVTGIDFNDAVDLLKHSATRKLTVEHANVDADWEESSVATVSNVAAAPAAEDKAALMRNRGLELLQRSKMKHLQHPYQQQRQHHQQ
jgi:C-terminal processing protease CtpA/Prc